MTRSQNMKFLCLTLDCGKSQRCWPGTIAPESTDTDSRLNKLPRLGSLLSAITATKHFAGTVCARVQPPMHAGKCNQWLRFLHCIHEMSMRCTAPKNRQHMSPESSAVSTTSCHLPYQAFQKWKHQPVATL